MASELSAGVDADGASPIARRFIPRLAGPSGVADYVLGVDDLPALAGRMRASGLVAEGPIAMSRARVDGVRLDHGELVGSQRTARQGGDVVLELGHAGGTDDRGRHARVAQHQGVADADGALDDRAVPDDGIRDPGVGVPKADLTRIFERFYKVDRARVRGRGGTGLGLSISRHVVESHGGRIWAESEEGFGSMFIFTVPLASARTAGQATPLDGESDIAPSALEAGAGPGAPSATDADLGTSA